MSALSPESVLVRNERLAWRVLDGEAVILFPEAGTLHRLNATGTVMWEQLNGDRTLADISTFLVSEYDAEHDEVARDLTHLADDLIDAGLARVEA
jgi:hypothetical protein